MSCSSLCDPPVGSAASLPWEGWVPSTPSSSPLSENLQSFRIGMEQLAANILDWSVCRFRRTQELGGLTWLPPSLPGVCRLRCTFAASVHPPHPPAPLSLSSSPISWLPGSGALCLIPALLDSSCLSGFHVTFFHLLFLFPISAPLPPTLSQCSDLAFSSSPLGLSLCCPVSISLSPPPSPPPFLTVSVQINEKGRAPCAWQ